MKDKISALMVMVLLATALFSFKMPERPPVEEVFTCPTDFAIVSSASGGCVSYYVTGANYANFSWVGWEVSYDAGGTNTFKTYGAGTAFITPSFGNACDDASIWYIRARALRICDGVSYLSGWVGPSN